MDDCECLLRWFCVVIILDIVTVKLTTITKSSYLLIIFYIILSLINY